MFPNPTFNTTIDMMGYMGTVTNNMFMPLLIVAMWIILFALFKANWRSEVSFTASSLIIFILAVIFRSAGLISDWIVIAVIFMFLAGAFITMKLSGDEAV